jgi:hypothetical protein
MTIKTTATITSLQHERDTYRHGDLGKISSDTIL